MKVSDERKRRRRTMISSEIEGQKEGERGKDEDEGEEEEKKAVKLIFCAEPLHVPQTTDMLRQKPGPGEAAWV